MTVDGITIESLNGEAAGEDRRQEPEAEPASGRPHSGVLAREEFSRSVRRRPTGKEGGSSDTARGMASHEGAR